MKRSIGYTTGTLMVMATLAISCADSDVEFDDAQVRRSEAEVIIDNLEQAGFPRSEIGVASDGRVFVGGDAVVTLQASRELAGILDDSSGESSDTFRQYRTTNVVDTSVVDVICINPTVAFSDNNLMSQALTSAIGKYNAQGLQFTMQVGGNNCDANIAAKLDNSGGGVSGFPANGLPYNEFFVGKDLAANYGVAVAAHVIVHELGHTIGFRHTDYFDRSISCGGGPSNEGDGGVGAIQIPGTPSGAVMNGSVMNACYNGGSTGDWTSSDVTALDCLYDSGNCAPPPPPPYETVDSRVNLSAGGGSQVHYGPYDASGLEALRVQISGGSGDADLYVRFGAAPTTNSYDCRPYVGGNEEICEFNPASSGNYYVMIAAYAAYSGLTLTVEGSGDVNPPPPAEVCDNGVDDDNDGDVDCDDSDCANDLACVGSYCGDNSCDVGESCDGRYGTVSCISDCPGKLNGKATRRYCYVDGECEGQGC